MLSLIMWENIEFFCLLFVLLRVLCDSTDPEAKQQITAVNHNHVNSWSNCQTRSNVNPDLVTALAMSHPKSLLKQILGLCFAEANHIFYLNAWTEYWFLFDHHFLAWQFDEFTSSRAGIQQLHHSFLFISGQVCMIMSSLKKQKRFNIKPSIYKENRYRPVWLMHAAYLRPCLEAPLTDGTEGGITCSPPANSGLVTGKVNRARRLIHQLVQTAAGRPNPDPHSPQRLFTRYA